MKKRFFLVEIISIIILCSLCIWYLGVVLRPADVGMAEMSIDLFHEYPEKSVDVIVYGSSHPWGAVNTNQMYGEYGISAYNYSCLWQQINTTKLFLEDSLRTQSPKIALIETYRVDDVIYDADMDGEVYYTRAISDFEGRRDYLRQCFQDNWLRYVSYYVPFVAFHENWMNLKFSDLIIHKPKEFENYTRGYGSGYKTYPVTIDQDQLSNQKELPQHAVEVLDDIIKISQEHNMQVIFFVVPFDNEEYNYRDAMKSYAVKNDTIYIDFFEKMDEIGIDEKTDFADEGHLNTNGARKITKYLSEFILENYDIVEK